ncbi:hypothetical protein E8E13_004231 [Curvularia kusanoi]|uniref:Rrn9 domain-containing protein n=1 Tax=Curvularia kusanoi TaxID=90978 RepID=A0A9P4THH4_CURKU|nr:hypothetical protein E8E13_004231 [Curvularia kusanoi]
MSLFGGDSSAPPTESEYDSGTDNSPPSVAQSPTHTNLRSPPSAQTTNDAINIRATATEDVDHEPAGNDADSEESDEEEPKRSNRFAGPPQTWKGYTAADRQIAESLQHFEDTDLAAHLYDAHALKRRVRKPTDALPTLKGWQNKDTWSKQGQELQYTDDVGQDQTELVPTKDWTAWPLPPSSLFTLKDGFRRAAVVPEDGEWVIGNSRAYNAAEELNDEMLGLFLRLAKDNWNSKEWQDGRRSGSAKYTRAHTRSRSKSAHPTINLQNSSDHEATGGKPGRKPQVESDIKPTILADDAKARALMQSTIAFMLTRLDELALGIQRTRLNHFGRGGFGENSSQSEFTTDGEITERDSISRPQSRVKSVPRSKPATRQSSRPGSSHGGQASSRTPKLTERPEDSDSASEYDARFDGRESPASVSSQSPALRRKRNGSLSTADEDDNSNTRDWSRAGLMDWSEVLGIAAVKGWDKKALARTAQRCASLFGESMSFRPLHEDLATGPVSESIQYTPSIIPAPPSIAGAIRPAKRPYWQAGAVHCPHPDCYGHYQKFRVAYRVIEHCMRNHGYDPRTNDSENEERTFGGVHIDGFMQPITAKQGWLGHGRFKAGGKRIKTEESESVPLKSSEEM